MGTYHTRLGSVPLVFLFITFAIISDENVSSASLIFELPDKENYCFSEDFDGVTVGKRFKFQYKVIRGGNNDVDAKVISPNGLVLFRESKNHEGEFVFDASRGEFRFCFGNEFSTFTHKIVYFELINMEISNLAVEAGDKIPTVKTSAEASCDVIHERMSSVVNYQREYRLKEAMGRHVAENINKGVSWWSVGQTFFILLAGVGQVLLLKTFFSEKSPIKQDA
ncbi:transmembrane emp24 domain-containing protein 3-like [Saccostrea cucullata]|uniref:transmembrane emp24 domain-containing protein 3-like n=1 Tax=Saccostrea cuccullata TaxID=36930 RepID=UPI002ED12054